MKNSVLETIGNTPMVRLKSNLFAKLEYFNPFGSVKDRAALHILHEAEKKGQISRVSTIIEATSGNMGISLSAIGSIMGYKTIIVMPENMSLRRRELIKAFGGEIILSDAKHGMRGAIEIAERLAKEKENVFMPRQFENFSGVWAHYLTTAPEISKQLDGKVDAVVCGIGTGGTITGIANYFYGKNVKVIGVEPEKSSYLLKGQVGAHKIEGIGAGFCPKILNIELINEIIGVSDDEALSCTRELFESDGIFVGISSGAVYAAAKAVAEREEFKGKNIVMLFADGGDRYL